MILRIALIFDSIVQILYEQNVVRVQWRRYCKNPSKADKNHSDVV